MMMMTMMMMIFVIIILHNGDDDNGVDNDDETRPRLLQVAKPADLVSPPHQLHKPWMKYLDVCIKYLRHLNI